MNDTTAITSKDELDSNVVVDDPKGEGMMLNGHKVMVKTINLNQDWKLIHNDLIGLLNVATHP